jgi:hypothetical protein
MHTFVSLRQDYHDFGYMRKPKPLIETKQKGKTESASGIRTRTGY